MSPPPDATDPAEDASSGRGPALWHRDYLLAMTVQLGVSLVFMTLMTYMALYAADRFGARDAWAGFAASAFILGSALARVLLGRHVEAIGRRRMLITGLAVFTACSALYPVADAYPVLVGVRLLHGAAFGAATTAVTAGVLAMVPASRRGEGMSYFLTASTLATAVGPLLAVRLSAGLGPGPVFLTTLAASVLALGAALVLRLPELPQDRSAARRPRRGLLPRRAADVLDPDALPVALVILLVSCGYAGVVTYVNPYLLDGGLETAASLFFVVFAGGMLLVRLVAGRLQDRRGPNAVVVPLGLAFCLALVLLAVAAQPWQVLLAGALAGAGYGGSGPTLQVVAASRARPERLGIATSTHYLMLDTGIAFGPVLFGTLIPVLGYRGHYLVLSAVVAAGMALYWFVHGRHGRAAPP